MTIEQKGITKQLKDMAYSVSCDTCESKALSEGTWRYNKFFELLGLENQSRKKATEIAEDHEAKFGRHHIIKIVGIKVPKYDHGPSDESFEDELGVIEDYSPFSHPPVL